MKLFPRFLFMGETIKNIHLYRVPFKSLRRSELHPRLYLVQIPYMIIFHTYWHKGLTKPNSISGSARWLLKRRISWGPAELIIQIGSVSSLIIYHTLHNLHSADRGKCTTRHLKKKCCELKGNWCISTLLFLMFIASILRGTCRRQFLTAMPATSVSFSALYGILQFCVKQYNNFEQHEEHVHMTR